MAKQAEMMLWFQGLFSGAYRFFDVLFAVITAFGEEFLIFILFPLFYWTINKEVSHLFAFAGFASLTANGLLKDAFKVARPCSLKYASYQIRFVEFENFFVNTKNLRLGDSYSFPSGHAQGLSTLLFSLAAYYKKYWLWVLAVAGVILVSMSRIYLGVHWPLDVLVGSLLGVIFALGAYFIFKKTNLKIRNIIYFILSGVFIILLVCAQKSDTFKAVGAFAGFSVGVWLENMCVRFDPKDGSVLRKIFRFLIGIILLLLLRIGLKSLFAFIGPYFILDFIRYFLIVFFGIFLYPLIFKKIKL